LPITLETTLDGIVQTHAGEADDNAFLQLVISTILAEENPARLLLPMVRGYLLGRKRGIVRAVEQATFRETRPDDTTAEPRVRVRGAAAVAATSPVMAARLAPILDEVIYCPGYGRVTWGAATVDQLRARADLYIQQRASLESAISDVDVAIRTIEDTPGATCLYDVYRAMPSA
jgi:hypothetical protein